MKSIDERAREHVLAHLTASGLADYPWALDMVKQAMLQTEELATERHEILQAAMIGEHAGSDLQRMRATVAAVMEAINRESEQPALGQPYVTVNIDDMRTIWDRFDLTSSLSEDETAVTFRLSRKKTILTPESTQ